MFAIANDDMIKPPDLSSFSHLCAVFLDAPPVHLVPGYAPDSQRHIILENDLVSTRGTISAAR
ncbi:hypothetical protein [Microbacterium sp.]|uniref:hypothetical protein n=1 Tax=Microbacterium sp. TaxID=51671 RepID=UPI003340302F